MGDARQLPIPRSPHRLPSVPPHPTQPLPPSSPAFPVYQPPSMNRSPAQELRHPVRAHRQKQMLLLILSAVQVSGTAGCSLLTPCCRWCEIVFFERKHARQSDTPGHFLNFLILVLCSELGWKVEWMHLFQPPSTL